MLANAARFLALGGKNVLALDLDLEAPGLHYKFKIGVPSGSGVVAYLLESLSRAEPPGIDEHLDRISLPEGSGSLTLLPAGNAPERRYWADLRRLEQQLAPTDIAGNGVAALLDLKARLEAELEPDYLLIDSRTGVTDVGGLATAVLADVVLCLFARNSESVDGTLMVVNALKQAPRLPGQDPIRVVAVEGRTPEGGGGGDLDEGISNVLDRQIDALMRVADGQKRSKDTVPFELPHDELHGAQDHLVAGERVASALSPLYEAYLKLFQHLFPELKTVAVEVLGRIGTMATLRERLTEESNSRSPWIRGLEPWQEESLAEGQHLVSTDRRERFADLVCYGPDRRPVMVAEFSPDGDIEGLKKVWSNFDGIRCVLVVTGDRPDRFRMKILTRRVDYEEFAEVDRSYWSPPMPKEFEILRDLGNLSLEAKLDALRRGHEEYLPDLIEAWQHMTSVGPHGGSPWEPQAARRILDALAAIDDAQTGFNLLAATAPELDPFEDRRRRGHHEDDIDRWTEEGLFAPLYWRLPVEAAFRYQSEGGHRRMGSPSSAGHKLLAEEIMGLRYNVDRVFRSETDSLRLRILRDALGAGDELNLHHLSHFWRALDLKYLFTDDPPAALLQDARVLEKDVSDRDRATKESRSWLSQVMTKRGRLHAWLRNKIDRNEVAIAGFLGSYDPETGAIALNRPIIDEVASLMHLKVRHLTSVAFIHLSVLAYAHQARDLDDQPGYGFAIGTSLNPLIRPNPAHAVIAQYFTYRLIEVLQDQNLKAAFTMLSESQPENYRRWRNMTAIPIESMRTVLLRARAGESTLGLPFPLIGGNEEA